MSKNLPQNPSVENLKKQAKYLLRLLKGGDPDATDKWQDWCVKSGKLDLVKSPTLRDVQHFIAQEYGYSTWRALSNSIVNSEPEEQTDEKHILNHTEVEAILRGIEQDHETDARNDVIHAHYGYAIALKIADKPDQAIEQLLECKRIARQDWPSQKMRLGVDALLQELGYKE